MKEFLTSLASLMGVFAFCRSFMRTVFPPELRSLAKKLFRFIFRRWLSSYCSYDINEFNGFGIHELYDDVKLYLSSSSAIDAASRLSISRSANSSTFTFSLAANECIVDTFNEATVTWRHSVTSVTSYQGNTSSRRRELQDTHAFTLRIKKKDRPLILPYLDHIRKVASEIRQKNKVRRLYTNSREHGYNHLWESVPFKHPSSFETLAMEPWKKEMIKSDLKAFAEGKSLYERTGRAWKRGYLLYGPPGTGKSSMIAAMANYLCYDVYDLELTQVFTNFELRKLLIKTTSKSIVVIEDIDCSVDLKKMSRKKQRMRPNDAPPGQIIPGGGRSDDDNDYVSMKAITLSGLLNFTDGLWSSCGSERIFVFTTNHIDNLDPALLRSGRMDMHIFMSYCSFSAMKILVKNYLGLEDGELDGEMGTEALLMDMEGLIDDAEITPADISEVLIKNKNRGKREAMEELLKVLKTRVEKKRQELDHQALQKKSLNEKLEEEKVEKQQAVESQKKDDQKMNICAGEGED